MIYAVVVGKEIKYYGSSSSFAFQIFNGNVGAKLFSAENEDDLKKELNDIGVISVICHKKDEDVLLKPMLEEGLRAVRCAADLALAKLKQAKERGGEAADDTKKLATSGASALGGLLQRLGERLQKAGR